MSGAEPLLQVTDLCVQFQTDEATVRAVDGVSFEVNRGEIVGVVGESGCGKSVTSLAIMGLLPEPQGRVTRGGLLFDGAELTRLGPKERRSLRGRRMAMVFQDPMSSLNPYLRVEEQLIETLMLHQGVARRPAHERAVAMLDRVGIPDAKLRIKDYPHQLSGGMRQRVMLAMALLCDPDLLILDEPTTALDVTIQAQFLQLLVGLKDERRLAAIFITHDLGVVANVCDHVLVMYAGRIVEQAPTRELFREPRHPYTRALLGSLPTRERKQRLANIQGLPPRLDQGPFEACRFAPRCGFVSEVCTRAEPPLRNHGPRQQSRCVRTLEELS